MRTIAAGSLVFLFAGAAVAQPANDGCDAPETISGLGIFPFDTTFASGGGPGVSCGTATDIAADVWFCWTADADGQVQISTCGAAGFDSVVAVYGGCACPDSEPLSCNDDACGLQSRAQLAVQAGRTYLIRVGGFSPAEVGAGAIAIEAYVPGVIRGPILSPVNGHTYYTLEPSSWTDAAASARAMGGSLATIRSAEENQWVFEQMLSWDGGLRRGWIGLNDAEEEGQFVWQSGEPVTFTAWGGGEPNDAGGVEDFVQIPWWAPEWNDNQDLPTDDPVYPIVELVPGPQCPPDFDGDGFLDLFDFDAFVDCFEGAACPPGRSADYDDDGFADLFDYDAFVADFEAGC